MSGHGGDASVSLAVAPEQDGERLDVVLAEVCGSRARAQRVIAAGAVLVDGRPASKRQAVQTGQTIVADLGVLAAPIQEVRGDAPPITVLHEDEQLLVVDKPAGLIVHHGAGQDGPTLVDAVAGYLSTTSPPGDDPERPGIVHRLDRETSGLLLIARDDATHRALQEAIRERSVTREYLALVDGRPDARSGTIDAPIGRDRHQRTRHSLDTDSPRRAVTHFTIEELLPRTSLLRVTLETGRTHQIRVHLKAIGLPVVGDPEYGRPHGEGQALGLERQFLHADRLTFDHPTTGERLQVESPLPDDLAQALGRARG
ncbi:Ribosomal large subunit pseudouridine synthase D [Patulibacter medicamentivorans]|uniref:Pseudouridine synthase n=1 Tax=Patulibacter medicamentivorans TaxID=1097667 RepID=H0E784_9ACTN|nr:RluA family pseudouridine synthase [Patulibacter medicamentivorans]EHN10459.1 Ribosomal large subunit pseudouridine synthase D [Patulibacter medicamentivorans]